MRNAIAAVLLAAAGAAAPPADASTQAPTQDQLKQLTIEELMRLDVTSTARRPEPFGTAAAAISVLTAEDIRRSGVTTLPDAIRLATGVHVARFNSGTWAISPRGFNSTTANKLLVTIDGRTVYSPLFTGVFWNMLDYSLADIDRIEVIRGPGATLWGANAVNGIVSVVTRHAAQTQGAYLSLASGNEDPVLATARYGGARGTTAWRVYGRVARRGSQRLASGASASDDRTRSQAGFRVDGGSAEATTWRLSGDAIHSADSFSDRPDGEFTDLNAQARIGVVLAPGSRVDVQTYYRREYRRVPQQLTHAINVGDVDAQHSWTIDPRHHVVWGGGVRVNRDRTHGSAVLAFDPATRTYPVSSLFAQDEVAIVPNRLFATIGLKYEHNAFSGGELQPNVRGRIMLPRGQMLWGAVSRAVRRPTRFEDDIVVFAPGGTVLVRGSDDYDAESLTAAEIGYRGTAGTLASFDVSVFRHAFDDLRSQDLPPGGLPLVVGNSLAGSSHGIEVAATLQPRLWSRVHVNYTWLRARIQRPAGSRDVGGGVTEANDPSHMFGARTSFDLPRNVELDAMLRAVGSLPNPRVPAYAELDLRVAWHPTPQVELFVTGQDLLHDEHPEFGADTPSRVEFERSLHLGITIRVGR